LLDLTLPDLSGDRVLAELARDPATAGLPVAVVSANARPDRIAELRATGVVAYLTKPLDVGVLARLLEGS
ncbi:MAG TPA: response regulator, partial [Gaiellaceae bacterium]|nr:response regulator [Gaiellaceae bacterium]